MTLGRVDAVENGRSGVVRLERERVIWSWLNACRGDGQTELGASSVRKKRIAQSSSLLQEA